MCRSEHELIIGGSVFPHKRVYKATWVSHNYTTENQIHHSCISINSEVHYTRCQSKKGSGWSPQITSDHHLLAGRPMLKLKRTARPEANRVKYVITLFKDPYIAPKITIKIRNKFQILQEMQDPEDPIEVSWEQMKETWTNKSEKILGRKKHHHGKAWISNDTISNITHKRA